MQRKELISGDLGRTVEIARGFAGELVSGGLEKTTVLLFEAEMGAGKTTFIRAFAEALGVEEKVTSPTFVGQNEYYSGKVPLIHIDAYQSKIDYADLEELTSEDLKKIIAIEWSEKIIPEFLEKLRANNDIEVFVIKISLGENENSRIIEIL